MHLLIIELKHADEASERLKRETKNDRNLAINQKSPKWPRDSDFDQFLFLRKDGPCTNSKLFTNCNVSWDTLYNPPNKNERKLKEKL